MRVTFNIPREAALRLKQLAEQGNASLRQMGVLGVQIEGDRLVSLTVATPNNQRAELIIRTHDGSGQAAAASGTPQSSASAGASISFDAGLPSSSDELGSPGPNMEVTRKNIEEYLRQGSLFNSILSPSSGAGPSGAGPSPDMFKAPSADGGAFRLNNIASDGMPGPSGMSAFQRRSAFPPIPGSGGHGHGAFAPPPLSAGGPMPGQRGPRVSAAHQMAQQQQQPPSQATALPQTAALGYNMVGLPPPPPYPHGAGVANNVGRQGKKVTASSPLLINLLQTEPVAGANNVMGTPGSGEKPKKKRRRRKDKQTVATSTSDGQVTGQAVHSLPLDSSPTSSVVPPQTMPSAEEMSAVLHRRVSPIPLPSPRLSAGFSNSVPPASDHAVGSEGFRDRKPATASAALASLAQCQRSTVESEQFIGDAIINPYTGHLEPRDSASDLSPVKKDQHKAGGDSLRDCPRKETAVSSAHLPTPVSVSAAKTTTESRTGSSDSVRVGLGSIHQGATVPSALKEERPRAFPSSAHSHSMATDTSVGQRPDLPHAAVTAAPSASPVSAAPHIYAQHPFGPSQPLLRMPPTAPQHSSHSPVAGTPTVNGPVSATSLPPSHAVSSGQSSPPSGGMAAGVGLEGASVAPYHMPSHRSQSSVRADVLHNVSVSGDVRVGGGVGGGHAAGDAGRPQPVTVTGTPPPVSHKAAPLADTRQGAAPATTASAQVHSDSLRLLNSSSSPALGAVQQRLAAESATTTSTTTTSSTATSTATTTTSPAGSKPPSDGDDNSNHSGISPVGPADGATAPPSLLDANGTKVDNHDSGVGSSSERSEDTTPSEVGDGEFQTSAAATEPSATDSNGGKPVAAAVSKAVVNCKKEAPGSTDPHTITVGFVQVNQHTADLYNKEAKKHIIDASSLIGRPMLWINW